MAAFVGVHVCIRPQETLASVTCRVGADRALEGRLFSRVPLSLLQACVCVCVLHPKPPSVQEVCERDESLGDEPSGRPSELGSDQLRASSTLILL